MNSELCSLVYFSRSTIPADQADAEILKILESARKQNPKVDVTGALLYSGNYFAQVLEGPFDAVQSTFERIRMDARHAEVSVLSCKPIDSRNFAQWSMAYATPASRITPSTMINGLLENPSCIDCDELGTEIVTVLQMLISGGESMSAQQ
ncbi:MAG: BLUF domain-containing protein [Acidobacteriota bacterium]|nr:BLUF domain-containing protein [Acidobacteriota bacterium]